MSSYPDNLDERIERELTKSGWIRRGEAPTAFYERPLSELTIRRMASSYATNLSKRKKVMLAIKRLFYRWFL
jgi:hypothetical protein